MHFCKNKFILDGCGCYSRQYPAIFNATPCLSEKDIHYTYTYMSKFNVTDSCFAECPPECNLVSYDFYSSFDSFPNQGLKFEYLRENPMIIEHFANDNVTYEQITFDMIKSSVACAYIYFDGIRYTSIVQSPSRLIIVRIFLSKFKYIHFKFELLTIIYFLGFAIRCWWNIR